MDARWHDNPGCWNAYVAGATSREQARERLQEAPEWMRPGIVAHVTTYRKLAQQAQERAEEHRLA